MGGALEEIGEPAIGVWQGRPSQAKLIEEDRGESQRFVDKWRAAGRGDAQRTASEFAPVILGETLEHKRFFDQALAGRYRFARPSRRRRGHRGRRVAGPLDRTVRPAMVNAFPLNIEH